MRQLSMETEHELRFLTVDFEEVMDIVHHNLKKAEQINLYGILHFFPNCHTSMSQNK
jgi:hypothetical protein